MASMNEILGKLDTLAALPQSALRIGTLVAGGNASAAELELIARQDEAVAMTVMRVANSSAYGRQGSAFTLRESITRLGNSALLKIVLQQKTSAVFATGGAAFGLQRGAIWRSALGGAFAAELIARRSRFANPDLAFLCALLRDIGKLALDASYGPEYQKLVAAHTRPDRTFTEAEREAFGFDHAQLGAELAIKWKLPQRIADCIRCHHTPPPPGSASPAHDALFDIVHAADTVGMWAGLAIGCDGLQYTFAEHVRLNLDFNRQVTEQLIATTWERLRLADSIMDRTTPAHPNRASA